MGFSRNLDELWGLMIQRIGFCAKKPWLSPWFLPRGFFNHGVLHMGTLQPSLGTLRQTICGYGKKNRTEWAMAFMVI